MATARKKLGARRKRRAAALKAAVTRKGRAIAKKVEEMWDVVKRKGAGRKAAITRKRKAAGAKAAATKRRRKSAKKAAATRAAKRG